MELQSAFTRLLILSALMRTARAQDSDPESVRGCCEGDVLFLLDSSGSVSFYEFSEMLSFLSELLRPFSVGAGAVRAGLLQVGTEPRLEFGLDAHDSQAGLQGALRSTTQLKGDTNTVDALLLARGRVFGAQGGAGRGLPRVLVWLTDGVDPGEVQEPMARLREDGVWVLVVSTGHGNYQVLREVATPPTEQHLYFVDIDDISIITEDLRNAIIEILRAGRLQVRALTSTSARLEWRPVLVGGGFYDIRFGPVPTGGSGGSGGHGTSPGTASLPHQRITRPGDASTAELSDLRPDTTYTVTLTPRTSGHAHNSLTTTFTTQPVKVEPEVELLTMVRVSDSSRDSVRVSWAPPLPRLVQSYQLEYWALPTGPLRTLSLSAQHHSTLLSHLQPDTQYLITVSARASSGRERAMTVRACTQEVLPSLADLQLAAVGNASVQLRWRGGAEGLRGYWVTWGRGQLYLPPHQLSTTLERVEPSARVCVSPVYRTSRGEGLCCTAS